MDLDFVRIECAIETIYSLKLDTALYDSLKTFEARFKEICCQKPLDSCSYCNLRPECPYWILFSQGLSSDPEIVRLHQKPSLPFSLYINVICDDMSCYEVGIVVIGSAVNYLDLFYLVLRSVVEAAVLTVLLPATFTHRSYILDYQGIRHEITNAVSLTKSVILLSGQHVLKSFVHSDSIRLLLLSPLRLLSNGSLAHRFDFGAFFRSQLRRCSSFYAYYGSGELGLDFERLSELAQNVTILDNNTQYVQPAWSRRLNRAGLIGVVECSGLIEPMFSLLMLGSYFNAGKGATFGLGFHKIEVM